MMKKRSRGQVIVLVALCIFVMLGFAALGIDVGFMYTVRNELQRCADAGALAGASAFTENPYIDNTNAEAYARRYASNDPVFGSPLDSVNEVGVMVYDQESPRRIHVDTWRNVPLYFARIFGISNRTINAYAEAIAEKPSLNVPCLKPLLIPFPYEDDNNNGRCDQGETSHTSCPDPRPADAENYFCPGSRIILKTGQPSGIKPNCIPDDPCTLGDETVPTGQQEPSHFFLADLNGINAPTCGQGNTFYDYFVGNLDTCAKEISIGDNICVQTGNAVGVTERAVDDSTNNSVPNFPRNNEWNCETVLPFDTDYKSSGRYIQIPVYDPCDPISAGNEQYFDQDGNLRSGNIQFKIAGFAAFWIESMGSGNCQGTVIGRYLESITGGGEADNSGEDEKLLYTIKLVK